MSSIQKLQQKISEIEKKKKDLLIKRSTQPPLSKNHIKFFSLKKRLSKYLPLKGSQPEETLLPRDGEIIDNIPGSLHVDGAFKNLSPDEKMQFCRLNKQLNDYIFQLYQLLKIDHPEEAALCLRRGHLAGLSKAYELLGDGLKSLQNRAENTTTFYFDKSDLPKDPDRLYALALCAILGLGRQQSLGHAIEYLKAAVDYQDAAAQNLLGYLYCYGCGVPQEQKTGIKYYQMAADQGYAAAQNNLGFSYQSGRGVTQDHKKAKKYYQMAVDQGYACALSNLGYLYEYELGVSQNYKKAHEYYKLAAMQGYACALNLLGYSYQYGCGISKDNEKARSFYEMAAKQDYAPALSNLGYLYEHGFGVFQSYAKAIEYYTSSAKKGYANAQYKLAVMYGDGTGVKQNSLMAVQMLWLLAMQKHERSVDQLKKRHTNDFFLLASNLLDRNYQECASALSKNPKLSEFLSELPFVLEHMLEGLTEGIVSVEEVQPVFEQLWGQASSFLSVNTLLADAVIQLAEVRKEKQGEQGEHIVGLLSNLLSHICYPNIEKDKIPELLNFFCDYYYEEERSSEINIAPIITLWYRVKTYASDQGQQVADYTFSTDVSMQGLAIILIKSRFEVFSLNADAQISMTIINKIVDYLENDELNIEQEVKKLLGDAVLSIKESRESKEISPRKGFFSATEELPEECSADKVVMNGLNS